MANKAASKTVRNYSWMIHKAVGGIMPQLEMLSDPKLGLLTKSVLSHISGLQANVEIPPDMLVLENMILRMCHLTPDGVVPLWAMLYARDRSSAPIIFAMSDEAVGAMIRCYITLIRTKKAQPFPADLPESGAVKAHMAQVAKWLDTLPPRELRDAYSEAGKAVDKLGDIIGLSEDERRTAKHAVGARFAGAPEVSANNREFILADMAENVRDGVDMTDREIMDSYREAEAQDRDEEPEAADAEPEEETEDEEVSSDEDEDDDYGIDDDDEPMEYDAIF